MTSHWAGIGMSDTCLLWSEVTPEDPRAKACECLPGTDHYLDCPAIAADESSVMTRWLDLTVPDGTVPTS